MRGEPPPAHLKVAINYAGGYRNTMILAIEGLDVDGQGRAGRAGALGPDTGRPACFRESRTSSWSGLIPRCCASRCSTGDKAKAGRAFSAAVVETALASYPGLLLADPAGDASMYGVYWPSAIPAKLIRCRVLIDGEEAWAGSPAVRPSGESKVSALAAESLASGSPAAAGQPVRRVPLGTIAGARSGDKGGNANVGVWVRTEAEFEWLDGYLTGQRLRELLPATAELPVQRYRLANLRALNFVIAGLLGRGVAASTRLDPQAKALGEELRAALADIPAQLLPPGQ